MATTSPTFANELSASEAARLIPFVRCPPVPPASELQELVLDRLIATGASDHSWSDYVLAALLGDAELRAALNGLAPPGVFLTSIAVTEFRGIGPTPTLSFRTGSRSRRSATTNSARCLAIVEGA